MKINGKGNKNKLYPKMKFKCKECDCKFTATKDEYSLAQWRDDLEYKINCPECKNTVVRKFTIQELENKLKKK
jgi:peptide subunit release factor 1 (eRF1)